MTSDHVEHCDCYRQSRASNADWVQAHAELLAQLEAAERELGAAQQAATAEAALHDLTRAERDEWKEDARQMTVNRDWWRDKCESAEHQRDVARDGLQQARTCLASIRSYDPMMPFRWKNYLSAFKAVKSTAQLGLDASELLDARTAPQEAGQREV